MESILKISAVIPVFNGKKYLKQAINSVIQQTLLPDELILVDDGSTDDFLSVIEDLVAPFPIRILRQENKGQSVARNEGIKLAKGNFIALLDQDDLWHQRHLEELSNPFKGDSSLGWTYSNVDHIDKDGNVISFNILNRCSFDHPQRNLLEMCKADMYILPGATLIQKKALFSVGLFDENLSGYEDDDLFLRLYAAGWKSIYIPDAFLQWRLHGANSGQVTGLKSMHIYARKIIQNFSSQFPDISEIVGKRFFRATYERYKLAIAEGHFSYSKMLCSHLQRHVALAPHSLHWWKYKMFLLKYPRAIKLAILFKNAQKVVARRAKKMARLVFSLAVKW